MGAVKNGVGKKREVIMTAQMKCCRRPGFPLGSIRSAVANNGSTMTSLFAGTRAYLAIGAIAVSGQAAFSFINFETAPIHPVALSPHGQTLAVCNLPDGRVELFSVASGVPTALGDVPVGVDPVTVRFRTTNELWVVNHISSSINVLNVAQRRVVATL